MIAVADESRGCLDEVGVEEERCGKAPRNHWRGFCAPIMTPPMEIAVLGKHFPLAACSISVKK